MYGKIRYDLTKEEILKRVSYWDLWSYYIPGVQLQKAFLSPLRNEKNGSASLFVAYDQSIILKDFGGEVYTIWSFLQKKYNLSYIEILLTINNDFDLNLATKKIVKPTMEFYGIAKRKKPLANSLRSEIAVKKRTWNDYDKQYWDTYHLDLKFIQKRGVIPLQNYWINDKLVYWYNTYNPAYSYEFKLDKKRKIYSPFSKEHKFYTNADNTIWQGEEYLPWIGDKLIINKSYKDVLVTENLSFNSVAPQSESQVFAEDKIEMLRKRFNQIYLLYDNDTTGIKYSNKNCEIFKDLIPIFVPLESNCKDISDYIKDYGYDNTLNLLKTMTK